MKLFENQCIFDLNKSSSPKVKYFEKLQFSQKSTLYVGSTCSLRVQSAFCSFQKKYSTCSLHSTQNPCTCTFGKIQVHAHIFVRDVRFVFSATQHIDTMNQLTNWYFKQPFYVFEKLKNLKSILHVDGVPGGVSNRSRWC